MGTRRAELRAPTRTYNAHVATGIPLRIKACAAGKQSITLACCIPKKPSKAELQETEWFNIRNVDCKGKTGYAQAMTQHFEWMPPRRMPQTKGCLNHKSGVSQIMAYTLFNSSDERSSAS